MNLLNILKQHFQNELSKLDTSEWDWLTFWLEVLCEKPWWKFDLKDLTIDHLNELLRVSAEGISAKELNPAISVEELLSNYGRWIFAEDKSFENAFDEYIFELEKEEREEELDREEAEKSESEDE
jgi:hypothetical protein